MRISDWSSDVCSSDLLACGVPMVLWSVLIDKVHRNPSNGIDWAQRRPWRDTLDISLTKLAGLLATWGLIALIYATMRYYWEGNYAVSMNLRSEEHTSGLQYIMRSSYALFCLQQTRH